MDANLEVSAHQENPPTYYAPLAAAEAQLEGNSRYPQTNFPRSIFLLHALLQDPHTDWIRVGRSVLDPLMVDISSETLSNSHHSHHIPHDTRAYMKEGDNEVFESRIQQLWRGSIYLAYYHLLSYIHNSPYQDVIGDQVRNASRVVSDQTSQEIASYLQKPENREKVVELKTIVSDIYRFLREDPSMKELSKKFLKSFRQEEGPNGEAMRFAYILDFLTALKRINGYSSFDTPPIEASRWNRWLGQIANEEISVAVRSYLDHGKFAYHNTTWLNPPTLQ